MKMDQTPDPLSQLPNDMEVDSDDYVVEPLENEKELLTLVPSVSRPNDGTAELLPDVPLADDYEAMKKLAFPPIADDPEIITEAVHTWKIDSWRSLARKEHGPIFMADGVPWRVLMFPSGNNCDSVSFYLELAPEEGVELSDDFYCCAQFALVLWNPNDPSIQYLQKANHRFNKEEADWGFTRFMDLRKLFNVPWENSTRPMVENEAVNMTAYVRIVKDETGVLWHSFANYDSKKETGYVGLKNQGATCYLNSLMQSLYFTNAFRKAIYQIPTQDEENLTNSAYTLQRLFYQLQTSQQAVSTNELTKSFGWETRHIFEQQDVQELSRKLMERMEEKMKGTAAENVLPRLFCGKVKTYISCINVDYESSRVEDFWDIQLNVRNNKNLEESFRDYVAVEKMDGDNQYFAGDNFKLQDANKGVIFQSFPEVLHLQLKRFEYDFERDAMMKINDRYEFPVTFDASPYLAEDADKSEPYIYELHGVLVHAGDLNAGHYYAFIKPNKNGHYYKYDDDKVIRSTMREVLEENFGGETLVNGTRSPLQKSSIRNSSAYMLVYIRQSRVGNVLPPVEVNDTPAHLKKKLDEEAALREARKKERDEMHLYTNVRVITEDVFKAHSGTDLASFDPIEKDPAAARSYRVLKISTLADLAERVAPDIGCDHKLLRFWCMVNRQNKTVRPDNPIKDTELIEVAHSRNVGQRVNEFRVWAEVAEATDSNGDPIWPLLASQQEKSDNIVILLKWFDVDAQKLRGVGHIYVGNQRKVEDLVPLILKKMGWPEKTPSGDRTQLKLFEEIKPQMVDSMKAKQTLKQAELQDGDIVCFQRVEDKLSGASGDKMEGIINGKTKPADWIEEANQYYDYLLNRRQLRFVPHPKSIGSYEAIETEMSLKSSYDQVAFKVAQQLSIDPTHLRFHTVNSNTGNPKAPVKRLPNVTLSSILSPAYTTFANNNQRTDELYFEVLDMSLSELDTKKNVKITWLSEGISKEETFDILVPKNGTNADLISGLIKKAQLEDEDTKGEIRIYGVHNHKIQKILSPGSNVANLNDYMALYAERVQEDEKDAEQGNFINAFHFQNEPNKPHGIPFVFTIRQDEKFLDTKKRLEKRTGLKGKNLEKIKFCVVTRVSYAKPTYLADDDVLWDVASQDDDLLGLDHPDRSRGAIGRTMDLFLK